MPVADLDDTATRASAIASDGSRPASTRVADLRRLAAGVTDAELLGQIDGYMASLELQREGENLEGVVEMLIARENAEIRQEIIARGEATPEELAAAGYLSHEALDAKAEDGTLQEAFGLIDPNILRRLALRRRRDHGRFADEFSSLAEPKPLKGRGGKSIAKKAAPKLPRPGIPSHSTPRRPTRPSRDAIIDQREVADAAQFAQQVNRYSEQDLRAILDRPHSDPRLLAAARKELAKRQAEAKPKKPAKPDAPEGTRENPINVGGNVQKAAELLAQGKHVELDQPHQVSTLLDELAAYVRRAEAAGEKAPNFNLCNVSVPGTNLFCADTKGHGRIEMPQLSGIPKPGSIAAELADEDGHVDLEMHFRAHLADQGIKVTDDEVPASHLRATQDELNGEKVAGIAGAIRSEGGLDGDPRLFVSSDDYIVDGHHRWAATVGVDAADDRLGDEDMPVARVDMPITELLQQANDFAEEMGIPQKSHGQEDSADKLADDYSLYIDHDPDKHPVVPVSSLIPTKPPESQPESVANATRLMNKAANEGGSKRKPIDVTDNGDGTYTVQDGNATTGAAQASGMTEMPVNVVGKKGSREAVVAQLDGFEDKETGLKLANTRSTASSDGRMDYTSDVVDKDGKKVGKVMRILKADGTLTRDQTTLDPEHQRKGFATRLMDHEEGIWRDAGAKKIDMVPISDSSKGFAEKHGFKPGEGFKVERPIKDAADTTAGSAAGEEAGAVMPDVFDEAETQPAIQSFGTIQEMFDAAKAAEPEFNDILAGGLADDLDALTPSTIEEAVENAENDPDSPQIVMGPIKKMERSMQKINGKYEGDHNRLQDVLRATVVVPHLDDFEGMVNALRENLPEGWEIRKAENRFLDPPPPHNVGATPSGYRDAAVALVSPSGVAAELQMNTAPMFRAKQGEGHTMYEESRQIEEDMRPKSPGTAGTSDREPGVTPARIARLRELEQRSTDLYNAAYEASIA